MSTMGVECIVMSASQDGEFAVVQTLRGKLTIGDTLVCPESGLVCTLVSFGLSEGPEAYEAGIRLVQLSFANSVPPTGALKRGMHLVSQHAMPLVPPP